MLGVAGRRKFLYGDAILSSDCLENLYAIYIIFSIINVLRTKFSYELLTINIYLRYDLEVAVPREIIFALIAVSSCLHIAIKSGDVKRNKTTL